MNFNNIYTAGLTGQDLLGQIQYRIKADAKDTVKIAFKTGAITFKDKGDTTFGFFGLPVEAAVKHHLQLSWDEHGVVQGMPTTFKVAGENGAPVEGAKVTVVGGAEIGVTDAQGTLVTGALTSEVKEYQLQAIKGDAYSPISKFKVSKLAGSPIPSNVSVTMGVDTTTSKAFTWHTDPATGDTVVEVVKKSEFTDFNAPNVKRFTGSSYLFNTTDTGTVRVHKAIASGLEPGTHYVFRVGDGHGNYSQNGTLQTAAATGERTKFIFLADSQASNEAGFKLWGDILKKAMTDHPDTEFVVQGGDLVEDGFKENEWNMWFNAAQGILMQTTVVPVVGNHEVTGARKTEDYLAHFNHPQNGIDSLKGSNFSFDYKNAHFVVLNSEYDFEQQKEWMRKDLAATDKKWKIVAFHRGPFGSMYDSEHIRDTWTPIFDEFQVDLVMNGHDHVYVRTYPMKDKKPVADGEGTTYIVGGSSGPKFYQVWAREWQKVTDGEQVQMYVAAEIDGDEMKFVVKTINDRVVDQFRLLKIPAQSVVIDKPMANLAVNESVKLNATVLPANASNKSVTWSVYSSSADNVVKVAADGLVIAQKLGSAVVRATSVWSNVYADSVITVDRLPQIRVEEVRLNQTSGKLKVGQELQLNATVLPVNVTQSVYWTVYGDTSKGIATVNGSGLVKAAAPGTATIRAMSAVDATKYADFRLTVEEAEKPTNPKVSEVRLNREVAVLKVEETLQLFATVLPENVLNKNVIWSVEGPAGIANVTDKGLVTTLNPGTVFIRATSQMDPTKYAQMELIVKERDDSGSSGGSGTPVTSGNSGNTEPPAVTPGKATVTQGTISVEAKIEAGTAKVEIRAEDLELAQKEARSDSDGAKVVRVEVKGAQNANHVEVSLPKKSVTKPAPDNKFEIVTPIGSVTVPSDFLKDKNAADTDFVSLVISKEDSSSLSEEARKEVGSRPIISLEVKEKGAFRAWNNPDTIVRIAIPYMPAAKEQENPGKIVIRYLDAAGRILPVPSGIYDSAAGMVRFEVKHFSKYAVAFVDKTFADIAEYAWAKPSIEALAARDIIQGMDAGTYAPALNISRADFVAMVVRTLELKASVTGNFKDVNGGDYYYEALGTAKELKIVEGTGAGIFNPKGKISRQDMFTITARALGAVRNMKMTASTETLAGFADRAKVAAYAADSLAGMVKEGLIEGDGQALNPEGNATRAEVAVFMYRILNKIYK